MLRPPRLFPLSPIAKNRFSTACCTLGLALALFLSLLKLFVLPCLGPGNCHAILYSAFGSVFGVPVGVFGSLLWIAAIVVSDQTKRGVLLGLLAAGTAIFMAIQFGVLRGFCLYCTLHAGAAWAALALYNGKPSRWALPLAVLIALGGFQLSRLHVAQASSTAVHSPKLTTLPDNPAALPWLGTVHPRSPALVLSLNCAACLDLLNQLSTRSYGGRDAGPAVYLKSNDKNHAVTVGFIAAVLAQRDVNRREAFFAVAATLLAEKDLCLGSPDAAAARLAAVFPLAISHQADAERIVAAQGAALERAGLGDVTPLLIPRSGQTRALFKIEELFPE
jgi:uncharacterized membrane protein